MDEEIQTSPPHHSNSTVMSDNDVRIIIADRNEDKVINEFLAISRTVIGVIPQYPIQFPLPGGS